MNYIKKNIMLIIILLVFIFGLIKLININPSYSATSDKISMDDMYKTIKEVMYSYYMRGPRIQYNSLKVNYFTPESATNQDTNYMVCSGFTRNVYYELLGIKIPAATADLLDYTEKNFGNKEVILFGKRENGKNKIQVYDEKEKKYISFENPTINKIIPYLKIGDVLTYSGHTLMIYDYVYDSNGNVIDLYTMESGHGNSNYQVKTKISPKTTVSSSIAFGSGNHMLYHNSRNNTNYSEGLKEGSLHLSKITLVSNWKELQKCTKARYSVLRFINENKDGYAGLYYLSSSKDYKGESITLPSNTIDRFKYSKLFIEKTVDVNANDVVSKGDNLTYTINIKNNSNNKYSNDLIVVENVPEHTTYKSYTISKSSIKLSKNNNKLTWNLGKLSSGEEITITYTISISDNCMNCEIDASGKVGNIPTSVKNTIGYNLSNNEQTNIIQKYNDLKNKYTGKKLINEIYKQALGYNLNFDKFDIKKLINNSKTNSSSNTSIGIKSDSYYEHMILNKYYSTIKYVKYTYNSEPLYYFDLKWWKPYTDPLRRADTIYAENFKTGDILVYLNKNDYVYDSASSSKINVTNENGEYAYIFIKDYGFVGVNLGSDSNSNIDDRNSFNHKYYSDNNLTLYTNPNEKNNDVLEFMNYQTLFGKDYYVILRPSLLMNSEVKIKYYQGNGTSSEGVKLLGESTCTYGKSCTLKKYSTFNTTFPLKNNKWSFAGWSTSKTGTTIKYNDGDSINLSNFDTINLYAVGKRGFTFSTGKNPTTASSVNYQYWNPYKISTSYVTSVFVPKYNDINGWQFIGYRGNSVASSTVTIKPSMVNKSEYKPAPNSLTSMEFRSIYKRDLTLQYNSNGGSGTIDSQKQVQYYNSGYGSGTNKGANVSTPTFVLKNNNFKNNGYYFSAWSSNKNDKYNEEYSYTKFSPSVDDTTTTLTMYALWNELYDYYIEKYIVDKNQKYITKIKGNTDINDFKKNIILNKEYNVSVESKRVNNKELLYTGSKTSIYKNGKVYKEFINIVSGDTNGDGVIDSNDYISVFNHINKTKHPNSKDKILEGIYFKAADLTSDNKLSYLDYVKIYNTIKEIKEN